MSPIEIALNKADIARAETVTVRREDLRELLTALHQVPCGVCNGNGLARRWPETNEEIEGMLEACAGDELPPEQFARMLRKIRGEAEIGIREMDDAALVDSQLTEAQRELVALHRAEGKELPPEIQELLEKLRKEATDQQNKDTDNGKRP